MPKCKSIIGIIIAFIESRSKIIESYTFTIRCRSIFDRSKSIASIKLDRSKVVILIVGILFLKFLSLRAKQ